MLFYDPIRPFIKILCDTCTIYLLFYILVCCICTILLLGEKPSPFPALYFEKINKIEMMIYYPLCEYHFNFIYFFKNIITKEIERKRNGDNLFSSRPAYLFWVNPGIIHA